MNDSGKCSIENKDRLASGTSLIIHITTPDLGINRTILDVISYLLRRTKTLGKLNAP